MPTDTISPLQAGLAHDAMVEDILRDIASGDLKVGQRIASETQLRARYGISINSIKAGLGQLVERGVLRRRRGSGTFVASRERVSTQRLVQRDTIAVLRGWQFWRYHPYFSEQVKGTFAGLAKHGWKHVDLVEQTYGSRPQVKEISHAHIPLQTLLLELEKHPEVAGLVCLQIDARTEAGLVDAGYTIVSTAVNSPGRSITYDWQEETSRLFRIVLQRGARTVGAISALSRAELEAAWQLACLATGVSATLRILETTKGPQGAALISQAYQRTLEVFAEPTDLDGLVVTSDYEAQGVTDALAQLPPERWQDLPVAALLNRESQIASPIPMTCLVADGHAYGMALADVLHDQITSATTGSRRMTLSCHRLDLS